MHRVGKVDLVALCRDAPQQKRGAIGVAVKTDVCGSKPVHEALADLVQPLAGVAIDLNQPRAFWRGVRADARNLEAEAGKFARRLANDLIDVGKLAVIAVAEAKQRHMHIFRARPTRIGTARRDDLAQVFLQKCQALDKLDIWFNGNGKYHDILLISSG